MLGIHMTFHNCNGNLKLIFNLGEGPIRLTVNSNTLTKFGRKFQQTQKKKKKYDKNLRNEKYVLHSHAYNHTRADKIIM